MQLVEVIDDTVVAGYDEVWTSGPDCMPQGVQWSQGAVTETIFDRSYPTDRTSGGNDHGDLSPDFRERKC